MPEQAKVIRKRIRSVSSTKKITRTMEMVATAKLKQAQGRVQSSGPYLQRMQALMREIGGSGVDVARSSNCRGVSFISRFLASSSGGGSSSSAAGGAALGAGGSGAG